MGASYWGNGNLSASNEAFAESSAVGGASGNKMLEVSGACNLAYSLEMEGRLHQAKNVFQNTFRLTKREGKVLAVAGYVHVEVARVLFEFNELDDSEQHLLKGVEYCQHLGDGRAEKIGHCLLARIHIAKGEFSVAYTVIKNSDKADPSPETSFDMRGAEYPLVRLWLKEKKLKEVDIWTLPIFNLL
jgi:LuxR family maltose regulon positive regulatory protein